MYYSTAKRDGDRERHFVRSENVKSYLISHAIDTIVTK